jgi:hypothetical protein
MDDGSHDNVTDRFEFPPLSSDLDAGFSSFTIPVDSETGNVSGSSCGEGVRRREESSLLLMEICKR